MLMVITDIGVQAMADAQLAGIKVKVTEFSIGDSFGYTPDTSATRLQGQEIYRGQPINFAVKGDREVTYLCRLEEHIGPFTFGEIGLYLDNGAFFAIGVSPIAISKTQAGGNQAGNIIDIDATIVYDNAGITLTFPVEDFTLAKLPRVAGIHHLTKPSMMDANAYLTDTPDDRGNHVTALAFNDNIWQFVSHRTQRFIGTVQASTASHVDVVGLENSAIDFAAGRYIVQFVNGNLVGEPRVVSAITNTRISWNEAYPSNPAIGDSLILYTTENDLDGGLFY